MTIKYFLLGVVVAIAFAAITTTALADSIGVNFSGDRSITVAGSDTVPNSDTEPLAATAVAGVTAVAQANWTNAGFKTGSSTSLIDSNGNATTASISWSSHNTYSTFGSTQSNANKQLMNGYLDTNETITMSGITYGTYDVYVYLGSDVAGRIGHGYLVSGGNTSSYTYFKTASSSFDGSAWVQGTGTYCTAVDTGNTDTNGNKIYSYTSDANSAQYLFFHNVSGASFTYYQSGNSGNVGVCAIQIVSTVPEPASTTLMIMGAGGMAAYGVWRRRRNRKEAFGYWVGKR